MPTPTRAARAALAGLLTLSAVAVAVAAPVASGNADAAPTYSNDNTRTGWYPNQPGLSSDAVARADFGQRFDAPVTGQVYAQPIASNGKLLVATEDNWIYGLNPITGAQAWARQLRKPFNAADVGCSDLTPRIGVTGTPVVDPAGTGTMYLLAKGYVNNVSGTAGYWLYSINVATGLDRYPPRQVGGTANNPANVAQRATWSARDQIQRPGLVLSGGRVYAAFSGHCGSGNYRGWVVGFNPTGATASAAPTLSAMWSATTNTFLNGAGIWMSGAGIMSDANGHLYVATGNAHGGKVPTAVNAVPVDGCGNCVLRLQSTGGALTATQFFSPKNANNLDANDSDLGAGGLMELPGTYAGKRVIVSAGKEGYVYLLDADNLGGFQQGAGHDDKVLGRVGRFGGVWSKPSTWPGDGGYVYIPTASPPAGANDPLIASGSSGYLQAYKIGTNGFGLPTLTKMTTEAANTDAILGFGSSSPVVTSNGSVGGSAVVWVVQTSGGDGTNAKLRAYRAVPSGGKMVLIKSFDIGTASKFNPPGVSNNRIYVGTRDGHVRGFGSTSPLLGSGVSFPSTKSGTTVTQSPAILAQTALTVQSVTVAGAGFSTSCGCTGAMAANTLRSIPVSFRPGVAGAYSGTLTVTTTAGTFQFALHGGAVAAPAPPKATPASVPFGAIKAGDTSSVSVTITNPGGTSATFSGVDLPAAPFSLSGVPANGTVIAAGGSKSFTVNYHAPASGSYSSSFRVRLSTGNVTVPVSGSVKLPGKLGVSATTLDVGGVVQGAQGVTTLRVSNGGQLPLQITLSKAPSGPFTALDPLPEGTTIAPSASITLRIAYTPTANGTQTGKWILDGDGASSQITVNLVGTGYVSTPSGTSFLRSVQPTRLADTRRDGSGRLDAGDTRQISTGVSALDGTNPGMVTVNVTAVNPSARGFITVFDCDVARPDTSNLNFLKGQTVANLSLVPRAGDGSICVYSSAPTDIVVDLAGYASDEEGMRYTAIAPTRFLDTRTPPNTYVKPGETRAVTLSGKGLPAAFDSVLVNVTAVSPAAAGFLTVFPCGIPRPNASNLNYTRATNTAGLVQVQARVGSRICVYSNVATHLIVDVQGFFRGQAGGGFLAGRDPIRALDTRLGGGPLIGGTSRQLTPAKLGVPANSTAVLVNVTAINPVGKGYVTVYPCGTAVPTTSVLNYTAQVTRANLVASKLGTGGLCVYSNVTTHLAVDTFGWFR
jgi:hypothetical protein